MLEVSSVGVWPHGHIAYGVVVGKGMCGDGLMRWRCGWAMSWCGNVEQTCGMW